MKINYSGIEDKILIKEEINGINIFYNNNYVNFENIRPLVNYFQETKLFRNIYYNINQNGHILGEETINTLFLGGVWFDFSLNNCNKVKININLSEGKCTSLTSSLRYSAYLIFRENVNQDIYEIILINQKLPVRKIGFYFKKYNILLLPYLEKSCIEIIIEDIFPILKEKINVIEEEFFRRDRTFSIGADPEFCFFHDDKLCNAAVVLGLNKKYRRLDFSDSEIGCDGHEATGELRPKPKKSISSVINELNRLIQKVNDDFSGYNIDTLGERTPLGMHIHIGGECFKKNIVNIENIVRIYDYFVGKHFLDLCGRARNSSNYKKLFSYRSQPWGFEYRVLPAFCYNDPKIFRIIIKLIYQLTKEYLHEKEFFLNQGHAPKEEYLKYLSAEEINYMFGFKNKYDEYSLNLEEGTLMKYWLKNEKIMNTPIFETRDFFSDEVKRIISEHRINQLGQFRFFGLRKDRGNNIATYYCRESDIIIIDKIFLFRRIEYKKRESIGIPYDIRREIKKEYDKFLVELLDYLYKQILGSIING